MVTLLHAALGAGGGALGGALAGFIAALLVLQARGWRNGRLLARGQPGYKDCVLPLAFVPLSALTAFLLGAVLGIFLTPWRAAAISAVAPAILLFFIGVGSAVAQSFEK